MINSQSFDGGLGRYSKGIGTQEAIRSIVDWEMCQIGAQALDLGQIIAGLYETKLFKNVDCGVLVIEGFLEGHGPLK